MIDPTQVQLIALIVFIIVITVWELVWKLIGMWKAGKNNQLTWFIVMGLINSVGIIPIVYIIFFQKKPRRIIR